jgi:DNA-binding MarR family transcriptional regulator
MKTDSEMMRREMSTEPAPSGPVGLYPTAVRELTPTAVAVYATLRSSDSPLGYDDLATEIGVSRRAVKAAIYDLRDRGLVASRPAPQTPSRRLHELADNSAETGGV